MTDLETYLKEVKERCERATEGPWSVDEWDQIKNVGIITGKNNSPFIAHARTDVPRLLEMVGLLHEILSCGVPHMLDFKDYKKRLEEIARGEG